MTMPVTLALQAAALALVLTGPPVQPAQDTLRAESAQNLTGA
jgi:hypothetical protein